MTSVAIIDYGSGNLRSAAKAIERAAHGSGSDGRVIVTAEPSEVRKATHVVLPGVGAFADCYRGLAALPGILDSLEEMVVEKTRPFLGICVGMQLMARQGEEHGLHEGLGWIPGTVSTLQPLQDSLKVPHMGWNDLIIDDSRHPVLAGLESGTHFYFVHSFHFLADEPTDRLAHIDYGGEVAAIVGRDNMIGTQFHPEKSQQAGQQLLTNFLRWHP